MMIQNEDAKRQTDENVIVSFKSPDPQKNTDGINSNAIANSFDKLGNSRSKTWYSLHIGQNDIHANRIVIPMKLLKDNRHSIQQSFTTANAW
jgi:hypothetical protein